MMRDLELFCDGKTFRLGSPRAWDEEDYDHIPTLAIAIKSLENEEDDDKPIRIEFPCHLHMDQVDLLTVMNYIIEVDIDPDTDRIDTLLEAANYLASTDFIILLLEKMCSIVLIDDSAVNSFDLAIAPIKRIQKYLHMINHEGFGTHVLADGDMGEMRKRWILTAIFYLSPFKHRSVEKDFDALLTSLFNQLVLNQSQAQQVAVWNFALKTMRLHYSKKKEDYKEWGHFSLPTRKSPVLPLFENDFLFTLQPYGRVKAVAMGKEEPEYQIQMKGGIKTVTTKEILEIVSFLTVVGGSEFGYEPCNDKEFVTVFEDVLNSK